MIPAASVFCRTSGGDQLVLMTECYQTPTRNCGTLRDSPCGFIGWNPRELHEEADRPARLDFMEDFRLDYTVQPRSQNHFFDLGL